MTRPDQDGGHTQGDNRSPPDSGTEFQQSKVRRRALLGAISAAGMAGASKLPSQWTRPVVDHAILPVHAQTTEQSGGGATMTTNCVVTCEAGEYYILTSSSVTDGTSLALVDYEAGDYTLCMDSFGGTSLTLIPTNITDSLLTDTQSTSSTSAQTTTFTTDSICVVTG